MSASECAAIEAKLDILIRLIAVDICGDRTQKEKIELLASAGLEPKTIAEILGTTRNTVSVAISGLRRQKEESRGKRQKRG